MSTTNVRHKLQAILEVCVMQELLNVAASDGTKGVLELHKQNMENTLDKIAAVIYEERANND